jgi:hypothetical protein
LQQFIKDVADKLGAFVTDIDVVVLFAFGKPSADPQGRWVSFQP